MVKRKRGVPVGYTHNWAYHGHWRERKTKAGTWAVDYRATKGRRNAGGGGPPVGTKITWNLHGTQTAVKTSKGTYQTRFRATKRLRSIRTPRRRRR